MASRGWDFFSLVPLVAIVVLVALVAALASIAARSEGERAAAKLATDALWVEQTLRFQMSVDEDVLVRFALDAASGTSQEVLMARARLHIATNPETLSVHWFDASGDLTAAVPEGVSPAETELVQRILKSTATTTARPIFGPVKDGAVPMALRLAASDGVIVASLAALDA